MDTTWGFERFLCYMNIILMIHCSFIIISQNKTWASHHFGKCKWCITVWILHGLQYYFLYAPHTYLKYECTNNLSMIQSIAVASAYSFIVVYFSRIRASFICCWNGLTKSFSICFLFVSKSFTLNWMISVHVKNKLRKLSFNFCYLICLRILEIYFVRPTSTHRRKLSVI